LTEGSNGARKGLLGRLLGSQHARTVTRHTEHLNLTVPADKADAVRVAVEGWLRARDVGAAVTSEDAGNGKSRISAKLDDADAAKVDFTDEQVQSDLQKAIADAVS